jgi:WbqC-like protein family
MTLACISQPSLFPWLGAFEKWAVSATYVHLDHVRFQKGGFLNRFRIAGDTGMAWITLPIEHTGSATRICDIRLHESMSAKRSQLRTLQHHYRKAPHVADATELLGDVLRIRSAFAADYAIKSMTTVGDYLGLREPELLLSSELEVGGAKTDMIIEIMRSVQATKYLFGPGSSGLENHYLNRSKMIAAGLELYCMDYSHHLSRLSILDLIALRGPAATAFIRPCSSRVAE